MLAHPLSPATLLVAKPGAKALWWRAPLSDMQDMHPQVSRVITGGDMW